MKADKPDLDLTALAELEARVDVAYAEGDMFTLRIAVRAWVRVGVDLFGTQQAKKGAVDSTGERNGLCQCISRGTVGQGLARSAV